MLQTSMYFLAPNDLYLRQKPYSLRFEPKQPFLQSNIRTEKHEDIVIEDIRGRENDFDFNANGFAVMPFTSQMAYDDFDDKQKLIELYLKEVADKLRNFLGALHVQIFEHTVRKRHDTFPISTGEPYKYNQPTTLAHVDATSEWVTELVRKINKEESHRLLQNRIQIVNVWKPLKGPVRDWPLALCDATTVTAENDFEPADLVYADYVVENCQVYHREGQKWYYLRDQVPSEALVFRQTDSEIGSSPGVPHCSFPNPLASKDDPSRESIEVRALVYYNPRETGPMENHDKIFDTQATIWTQAS